MTTYHALDTMGAVTATTAATAREVLAAADRAGHTVPVIWGLNPNSRPEHSSGRALDFMVYSDKDAGDWIADYLWRNRSRLRVKWVIWRQRIRSTSPGKPASWQKMGDRGGPTANHMDHVHVFLAPGAYRAPATNKRPRVSLSAVQAAARKDGPRPQGGTTPGAADDVRLVEAALHAEGLLDGKWSKDGSFGDKTVAAYSEWQVRSTNAVGKGKDGIPGAQSLTILGRRHGFDVIA